MSHNHPVAETAPETSSASHSIPLHMRRPQTADAAAAEFAADGYLDPAVHRLRRWAMRTNAQISQESFFNANVEALPLGVAISLMIGASLMLWSAVAGVLVLLF